MKLRPYLFCPYILLTEPIHMYKSCVILLSTYKYFSLYTCTCQLEVPTVHIFFTTAIVLGSNLKNRETCSFPLRLPYFWEWRGLGTSDRSWWSTSHQRIVFTTSQHSFDVFPPRGSSVTNCSHRLGKFFWPKTIRKSLLSESLSPPHCSVQAGG